MPHGVESQPRPLCLCSAPPGKIPRPKSRWTVVLKAEGQAVRAGAGPARGLCWGRRRHSRTRWVLALPSKARAAWKGIKLSDLLFGRARTVAMSPVDVCWLFIRHQVPRARRGQVSRQPHEMGAIIGPLDKWGTSWHKSLEHMPRLEEDRSRV